jgi:SHS family lactate transporter-like MFS transporter
MGAPSCRSGNPFDGLRGLDRDQWAACVASLCGWTLDAFDYFLMVFMLRSIAADFHSEVKDVAYGLFLTLAFRPLGALVFGWLADRYGRRPVLMMDIVLFSLIELASAFAPSLRALLILRALFGFAMGGEWGIGASLAMETIPTQSRGIVSGILQEGYALGYLLAAVVYGLAFDRVGWRGLFAIGVLPALLVLYIRLSVRESPAWSRQSARADRPGLLRSLAGHWKLLAYAVLLMAGFNFLSHGTQDFFPTFLQGQRHLSTHAVSAVLVAANLGAITGGVFFGVYSQRAGRRRAIVIASLLAIPIVPLWALAKTPILVGLGAYLLQVAVQGAWGVVPAHLNELSPAAIRGTFPGFSYQIGNLIAASNAIIQPAIASASGGNYALALASVAAITAVVLALVAGLGPEAREAQLDGSNSG